MIDIAQAMSTALDVLGEKGHLTPVSLDMHEDVPFERYEQLAGLFGRVKRSTSWWIGDLLNFGEATYGEKYAQAAHATGLAESTLMNYTYVCRQVPKSRRRERVPFSCHYEVAPLPPREQRKWLAVAEKEELTQRELRLRIKLAAGDNTATGAATGNGDVAPAVRLREIAAGLFHHAVRDSAGFHRVPSEWVAQLGAALGVDE